MKKFLLASFILFQVFANAQAPTSGLVAYFPFNGNTTNSGSAAITANPIGTSYTSNNLNVANSAIQFPGNINSYVDFTDNGNLDFSGTNNFSVCIGFYVSGSNTGGLFDNGLNYAGFGVWFWFINGPNPNIQFNYKNGSVGSVATSFTAGQWHHVVAVRNNGTLSVYIDGVFKQSGSEGTQTPTYPLSPQAGAMVYGGYSPPRYNPFNGKMDELRIYNRALSADEITAVYNDYVTGGVQPVTITCPSNITVPNDAGQCGAIVNYPVATATGTPAPTISYSKASGTFFSVGTTTVTATATNGTSSSATCSFTVTVTGGTDTDADGNPDVCDTDDDNDGVVDGSDCAPLDNTKWQQALLYIDNDNDNYTNGQQTVCYGATIPNGFKASSLGSDCNDNNPLVWQSVFLYIDNDNDNYTNGQQTVCYGATIPVGFKATSLGSDCNDNNNLVWQSSSLYIDNDGDGYTNGQQVVCYGASVPTGYSASSLGSDCNDNNPAVHPGATEICNDIDDDCDGSIDEGFINTVVTCPFTGTVTKNLLSGCTYIVNGNEFNATVSQNCGPLGYTLTGATTGTGVSLANVQLNTGTTAVTWSAMNANDQVFSCSFNVYVVPAPPTITCPDNIIVPVATGQCGAVVNYTAPALPNLCTNNTDLPPTTVTFIYTGQGVNWTVPSGVNKINIEAWGAEGGRSVAILSQGFSGKGGYSKGELNVTPGEVLHIVVGGKGTDFRGAGNGAGGFNGGGTGDLNGFNEGAGGGGASDVRQGGTTLIYRVLVAGGGGGGGWFGNGGDGGGLTGNNGTGSLPGFGGTQVAGGIRGADLCTFSISGSNGSFGIGGDGANGGCGSGGGGGGGGGYYGGGGGGTQSPNLGSGGGGGSSFIGGLANSSTSVGGRSGNGIITITYGSSEAGITQTGGLASGSNFPLGTTTNTFLITDAFGQTSSCSFTVTVNDEQAPVIVQPTNIMVNNTVDQCSASVSFSTSASDNCAVTSLKYYINYNTAQQEEISSPKTFATGSYVVTVVAKDAANNTTTKTFTITVIDNQPPSIICPAPVTINASPGLCTGTTTLTPPTVIDNCNSFGNALSFGGGYVNVPNTPILNPFNEWTLETWVKRTNTGVQESLIEKYVEPGNTYGYLLRILGNDKAQAGFVFGSFAGYFIMGNTTILPNIWYHLATTVNRTTGVMKLYVNGVLDAQVTGMTGLPTIPNTASLKLGARGDDAATRLSNGGIMDEIRIWSVERTQAQIQLNMNNELSAQSGLVALYHLNQGIAGGNNTGLTTATDASGNSNNGSLISFALTGPTSNWVNGQGFGATVTNNAPATYPKGNTNVTWTATDGSGNTATCIQVVTVVDNQAPVITCPVTGNTNRNTNAGVCTYTTMLTEFNATATDNCTITSLTYELTGVTTGTGATLAGVVFNKGVTIVTWTASDGVTTNATCSFTVTVNDKEDPIFTCPANQNVNLSNTCQLVVPDLVNGLIGSDNCGIVTFTQSPLAGASLASLHNQTHNIVITANDGNGNTQTCTVVLTGKDVTKPTFICPDNQNVNLNGACQLVVPNLISELTGNDNCGTVTFTQSPIAGASLASSHNQTHNVVITASDGNGNTQTCTVVLTGKDVTKPTFICPDDQNVNLNGTCQLSVPNLIAELSGNDNCGTVTFTQNPLAGASLASSHNQTHNVLITASDGNGNTQTCTVVLTGKDVTKPTFTCPYNRNVNLNGTCQLIVPNLIYGLTGNDNCGTVTFTQSPVAGASLASSHNQTHNVVITASDGNGNTQTCTVVLTGKDVTKPTFTCPNDQDVNLNGTCQLIVPNLIYGLTGNDNCGIVTFIQSPVAGASLASSHNQTHSIVITASDGNGNTQTCTVVLTGKDVTKPTFTCPYNRNVNLNGTCQLIVPNLIYGLTGNDNCGTVTFTQSPVAGASLASSHNQTHNVLITASDGNGNTQTCTVILTGKDVTKPTFTCPYNQNVNLNGTCQLIVPNLIYGLTGNDNCGTVTFTQSPVAGASLASSHNQTQNVLITANDGNGNTETCTVVLTAKDVTLPVITCPSPKTISCDASILPANTGSATATDNCSGVLVITYSDVSGQDPNTSHAGYYNYTITRTWKAMDVATNTSTCNQTITVQDITKPMITCPASKLNVPFDFGQLYATIAIGTGTATDNCAANANIAIAGTRSDNVVITNQQYPLGQTTVAWSATDPSDNSDGCTQTITVRKRNTAVTYTGDMTDNKICVQYSDIINLQAKLTDNEGLVTPNNIGGRTITFQLLSGTTVLRSKSATTNANGVAVDTFKVEQSPGLYLVKTIFAGDGYFNVSNDQDNCEVKQEDAVVEYNGSQYFTTPSATTLTGSITLAASINDIDDGSDKRGDIRKAKATFRDGGPASNVLGSANLPVGLVTPGVLTNGLSATTQNNIILNSNDAGSGGKIFQVWVGANDHYTGADAGPTPVTLALPGQDFVTGGGHLVLTNSAGTYAGTVNSKMNFGFTMKWNKSGKNLQGNINIVFRKWQLYNGVWQWRIYQVKSNAINSMAVVEVGSNGELASATNPAVFRKAIINTKANLKDVTDPLNNIDLGGNHNLTLDAWDHITANGGVSDKISVTLMGATTNELLFSSSWVSNATTAQTITGGNINVRNGSSGSITSLNSITKSGQMEVAAKEDAFVVKAYPNPTEHEFTLIVSSSLNEKLEIVLYDAAGRKIQTLSAKANETIRFGEKLKAGVYIAQVIQGNKKASIKLIKQ